MKLQKKILLIFLILIFALTVKVSALSEGDVITYDGIMATMPATEVEEGYIEDDALFIELSSQPMTLSDDTSSTDISNYISQYETTGESAIGIDVSKYQGDIDWAAVSNAGVKFAMIRCGFRGLTSGTIYEDEYFKTNITNAINNGIYVGVYFYSAAITEEEALQEAAFVVDLIKNYDIKYPVAYDFENFSAEEYRTDGLSADQINANASTFLNYVKGQGYNACLYGSTSYLNSTWNSSLRTTYPVWVAHYGVSQPTYTGSYVMWQCTSTGTVSGISGYVDVDVDYQYYMSYNNIDISDYLFNSTYYADRYADVKAAFGYDETALRNHYENFGKSEGRSASPAFDPMYYLDKYSDVKAAFGTNYVSAYNHFVSYGIYEGRQGSKYFSATYYLSNNADVKKSYYSSKTYALVHFASFGINEGRIGSSDFNVVTYYNSQNAMIKTALGKNYLKYYALASGGDFSTKSVASIFDSTYYADKYADVRAVYGYDETALRNHYESFGKAEGRTPSAVFDPVYYLSTYSDVKLAFGVDYVAAYNHFMSYGIYEGRQGSKYFNVTYYLNKYTDVVSVFGIDYAAGATHFVTFGLSEGRQGSSEFNIVAYVNNYSDLKAAFGTNYKAALIHYETYGKNENRKTV